MFTEIQEFATPPNGSSPSRRKTCRKSTDISVTGRHTGKFGKVRTRRVLRVLASGFGISIYGPMRSFFRPPLIAAIALVLAGTGSAIAQNKGFIDKFGDWNAFADQENGQPLCYMASLPEKSEGKYTQRGDTYIMVTHRPAEKTFGEVSIRAGYAYKQDSDTEARIDSNQPFKLFTDGEFSWARDTDTDRALIANMKAGSTVIVKGTSSRGTLTIDTYSLKGFTAAYAAISKACKVK
jgi:invasion associated locus B (IalB) protein